MRKFVTILSLFTVMAFVGCKSNEVIDPTLALSESGDLFFSASGTEKLTVAVVTNQESWDVNSDKEWCIVTPSADRTYFSIAITPNMTEIPVGDATITVKALAGSAVVATKTLKASQGAMVGGLKFVNIPQGEFTMGDPEGNKWGGNEKPAHKVILSHGFRMSVYETTNAQYADFLNAKNIKGENIIYHRNILVGWDFIDGQSVPVYQEDDINLTVAKGPTPNDGEQIYTFDCTFDPTAPQGYPWVPLHPHEFGLLFQNGKWIPAPGFENYPAINISWHGARAFAHWLGGELPTEAQWEYACKAGTDTYFSFGSDFELFAEYGWAGSWYTPIDATPHEVGLLKKNPWGLYDMYGNVSEMCLDRFEIDLKLGDTYVERTVTDPVVKSNGEIMIRGGSYKYPASRSTSRAWAPVDQFEWEESFRNGFRVVINLK